MEKVDLEKVKDKIQKLLALSTSSNEHEAALAAQRAGEILAKYNLSMAEVDAKDDNKNSQVETMELDRLQEGNYIWEGTLAATISKIFDCQAIRIYSWQSSSKYKYEFFGVKHDLELMIHFFRYLRLRIMTDAERYQNKKDKYTFAMGMIAAIARRLKAMMKVKQQVVQQAVNEAREQGQEHAESMALMVIGKELTVQEAFKEKHKKTHTIKQDIKMERNKYIEGENAGNKVALSRPIENNGTPNQQIK